MCVMSKIDFDFYYGVEAEQFTFIRVPKVLFTDKEHFGNLSSDAKILYGLLLERMSLSRKNNWIDKENRVYIIFPIEEIEETMSVCHEKASNILKELDDVNGIGLVKKKRRGLGLPSILYVKNFIINNSENLRPEEVSDDSISQDNSAQTSRSMKNGFQEVGKTDFLKSEIPTSANRKNILQEVGKTDANNIKINNTERNYTDNQSINHSGASFQNFSTADVENDGLIDRTETEESVKAQIDYDCLISHPDKSVVQMIEEIKDLIVDVICGERNVIIEGRRVSEEAARSAYRKLTSEHVMDVLKNILNYPEKIKRIDRFLTVALYNSVFTFTTSTFSGFEHNLGMTMI